MLRRARAGGRSPRSREERRREVTMRHRYGRTDGRTNERAKKETGRRSRGLTLTWKFKPSVRVCLTISSHRTIPRQLSRYLALHWTFPLRPSTKKMNGEPDADGRGLFPYVCLVRQLFRRRRTLLIEIRAAFLAHYLPPTLRALNRPTSFTPPR